ncbi:homocysteine S-methyltransferase family protein [Dyadobacter sp. CY326]|uniref:homocysteine S-methyltransferase family protein n=1 Tax=Dyadobacter sp. CY326 TaxID=2907300 RepID=UPI00286EB1D0|nr:homocysteine S-methyltransferase family protein [Dyadobacter sp. CY326]
MHAIEIEAEQRILLLDGAMGTMIQQLGLAEADFRNSSLSDHPIELKGNNDLLNLTRPDVIKDIHVQYLNAGADILSTNTFGANGISQADYEAEHLVYEINYQGAKLAKDAVLEFQRSNNVKPLFVAGAMGPTTKLTSLSPDVNNPGFRAVDFDQLENAYTEQANALIEGGVDLFLLETITDTLNAKAALFALMTIFEKIGQKYPIMVSGTITDASGRILSGQTVEAFIISISHAPILSIGLNCALGAKELRPYIEVLDRESPFMVSTHPNAGLPNQFGEYDQSAEEFAALVGEFAGNGWLNIVGGCCGTTPHHIAAAAKAIKTIPPRKKPGIDNRMIKTVTNSKAVTVVDQWTNAIAASKPTFSLSELMTIVSQVEDETTLGKVKVKFDAEKRLYHSEQAMLLNAHIFGRYNYLRAKNKIAGISA